MRSAGGRSASRGAQQAAASTGRGSQIDARIAAATGPRHFHTGNQDSQARSASEGFESATRVRRLIATVCALQREVAQCCGAAAHRPGNTRTARGTPTESATPPAITREMRALVESIDGHCDQTCGHGTRVGLLAARTARALGLPLQQQSMLELAGLLHDVGKLGLPSELLSKPGKLTAAEFELVRHHPRMGHQLLAPLDVPRQVLDAVLHHHENHDGSGYPDGLRGAAIPLPAQVIHVADVFDALTSPRAYRGALTSEAACDLLLRDSGRVTHPVVTLAFLRALARLRRIEPAAYERWFGHIPGEPGSSSVTHAAPAVATR